MLQRTIFGKSNDVRQYKHKNKTPRQQKQEITDLSDFSIHTSPVIESNMSREGKMYAELKIKSLPHCWLGGGMAGARQRQKPEHQVQYLRPHAKGGSQLQPRYHKPQRQHKQSQPGQTRSS